MKIVHASMNTLYSSMKTPYSSMKMSYSTQPKKEMGNRLRDRRVRLLRYLFGYNGSIISLRRKEGNYGYLLPG
jgi:hypothetical protein